MRIWGAVLLGGRKGRYVKRRLTIGWIGINFELGRRKHPFEDWTYQYLKKLGCRNAMASAIHSYIHIQAHP